MISEAKMGRSRFSSLKIPLAAFCCSCIISVRVVEARELKVVDESGLIRSVKSVEESATVTVSIEAENGQILNVSRVDGVGETHQQVVSQKEVQFKDLAAGIWRVEGDPRKIRSIRIESR